MLTTTDFDTSRQALAFVRAFLQGDAEGANTMLLTLPADELPGFVSTMATMLREALVIGEVPPAPFFAAFGALLDAQEGEL